MGKAPEIPVLFDWKGKAARNGAGNGAREHFGARAGSAYSGILDQTGGASLKGAGDMPLDARLDMFQAILDTIGLAPIVGEPADLLNAGISLARGNYTDAILSAFSAVPFAGWTSTAGKGARYALKGADAIGTAGKSTGKAVKAGGAILEAGVLDELVECAGKVGDELVEGAGKTANELVEDAGKTIPNQLTRAQSRNTSTLNNIIENNLKETDFSGTLADLQGKPIPNGIGGYFDHLTEMKQSYAGLKRVKSGLEGSLKNPSLIPEVRAFLLENLDTINYYLRKIEDLFKPYGGIK